MIEGLLGIKKAGESTIAWSFVGGGLGLGVGIATLLCRFRWLRILVAPPLALGGATCGITLYSLVRDRYVDVPRLETFLQPIWAAMALIHPLLMVVAHLVSLKLGRRAAGRGMDLAVYGAAGILSGLALVGLGHDYFGPRPIESGLLSGVMDGLLQFVAMRAAQAFSGLPWREERGIP